MRFKASSSLQLDSLVHETVIYRFQADKAVEYINEKFKPLSIDIETYQKRKKKLIKNDTNISLWLNAYAKIGFALKHKQILEDIEQILTDNWRDYQIENSKPYEEKNKDLCFKYREEIRKNNILLQELSLGSPIIAQIRSQIERYETKLAETKNKMIQANAIVVSPNNNNK